MYARLTRTMRLTLTAGVLAIPATALADLPPALDRVTTDAAIVIATPSVSDVIAGLEAFQDLGLGDMAEVTGFIDAMPGLNLDGSAALGMIMTEDFETTGPDQFVVLPVADYGAFLEGIGGEGDGVAEVFIEGEAAYVTNMGGGYAIVASTADLADTYGDVSGSAATFETLVGPAGNNAASNSDAIAIINIDSVRPMLQDGFDEMVQEMEMAAEMQGMGPMAGMMGALGQALLDQGQGMVLGLNFAEAGMTLNAAAQFTQGSDMAGMLTGEGNSADLLQRVPEGPFFVAMAVDMRSALAAGVMDMSNQLNKMQADMTGVPAPPEMDSSLMSGLAWVVGAPPGGMMGGLLTATSTYIASEEPEAILAYNAQTFGMMKDMELPTMALDATYTENATTIANHSVNSWSMGFDFGDDPQMMQMQMMMPMLFGPGGLGGFSAGVDGGVVMTMSKNPRLMESAINAAENGGGLGTNDTIQAVAGHLPSNRSCEMYLGADDIFTMVGALAAMGAMPVQADFPEGVPPVAVGLGFTGGGAHGAVFVPTQVLEFAAQMSAMAGGMGPGDDF